MLLSLNFIETTEVGVFKIVVTRQTHDVHVYDVISKGMTSFVVLYLFRGTERVRFMEVYMLGYMYVCTWRVISGGYGS